MLSWRGSQESMGKGKIVLFNVIERKFGRENNKSSPYLGYTKMYYRIRPTLFTTNSYCSKPLTLCLCASEKNIYPDQLHL